jgi:GxxExxY protein
VAEISTDPPEYWAAMIECWANREDCSADTGLASSGSVSASEEAQRINPLSYRVIGAAIRVHRELGPGMLESAYQACLHVELVDEGLSVQRQVPLPVTYRGRRVDCGFRIDLVVDDALLVEIKAVERILPVHRAQVRSYLQQTGLKLGLLINFNVTRLHDGIARIVNHLAE